jgi:hypothetical protein
MRASDDDRERTVTVLREAFGEGRLNLDEFDERTSAAYAARTWGELRGLTEDLPVQASFELDPTRHLDAALPSLTPVRPEALPPAMSQRRGRSLGPLLPIVLVWAMIAAGTSNPTAAAALACLFVCLVAVRIASGGRR